MEVVADVETGVSLDFFEKTTRVVIVITDRFGLQEVMYGVFGNISGWTRRVTADGNIDNDVSGIIHDLQALLNSRVQVDVPDRTTVHVDIAIEGKAGEDDGNGGR